MNVNESYEKVTIRPWKCLMTGKDLVAPQYWLFVGICAGGLLMGGIAPMGLLLGPMMCGLYLCYFARMRGERVEFGLLFKGFDYFYESFVATLVLMGIGLLLSLPIFALIIAAVVSLALPGLRASVTESEAAAHTAASIPAVLVAGGVVAVVLLVVLGVMAGMLTAFVYPLIIDRKLKALAACRVSCCAVWANLRGLVGLSMLLAVIGMAAAICLYFPVFLFLPISFGALAVVHRKIFPELPA